MSDVLDIDSQSTLYKRSWKQSKLVRIAKIYFDGDVDIYPKIDGTVHVICKSFDVGNIPPGDIVIKAVKPWDRYPWMEITLDWCDGK